MFFGSLISTYIIYHGRLSTYMPFHGKLVTPKIWEQAPGGASTGVFSILTTSQSTFVLLMSSYLMVLTLAAIQEGRLGRFRFFCFGTALFGSIFLGYQAFEFSSFVNEGLTLSQSLFGSTFFVLTGTHGCHVAIGVLWLMSLLIYSYTGKMTSARALDVEIAGLYWHFVDIVWIVIFTVVYLVPYVTSPMG